MDQSSPFFRPTWKALYLIKFFFDFRHVDEIPIAAAGIWEQFTPVC